MAALGAQNAILLWQDGVAETAALFALRKVTAGDTFDLSGWFNPPLRGALVGATVAGVSAATISGNVLTIPAGVTNDAAYLLVFGVHV